MENAEMSLNANAIGGFRGMDAFKKAFSVDQSEVDSGYVENWSISHHSNATASISGLSSSAKLSLSSFKKSGDLEPISESVDLEGEIWKTKITNQENIPIFFFNCCHRSPRNPNHPKYTTFEIISHTNTAECAQPTRNDTDKGQLFFQFVR